MTDSIDLSVRKTITVEAPQALAFDVFTTQMSTWWPLETHHIGAAPAEATLMEPHIGGRWYEQASDGTTCEWGRVLEWDPPHRVVLLWAISSQWVHDPAITSEVEIRFVEEASDRTRVELEHRNLDTFGNEAETMAAIFDSEGGWTGLLGSFAAAVKSR
jgi:uncharacterized protein YndB with AHSA1/START domain